MKIKRFEQITENMSDTKFYVFSIPQGGKTYRGSIWTNPELPWIPDGSKLVAEFDTAGRAYKIVSQSELDEINRIKQEAEIKKDSKNYNL